MYVVCYLNVRCTYSTALGEVVRIIKQRLKKKDEDRILESGIRAKQGDNTDP